MNIFIYTYSYDANIGGVIALHRLCHVINTTTSHHAFLVSDKWTQPWLKRIRSKLRKKNLFKIHDGWETPVWTERQFPEDAIVIYPEVVEGNPLEISNVVRWLLHQPGFHTGKINYGKNELYFKFNSAINDFKRESCKLAENELKVIYYPIDTYINKGLIRDIECCYMVRKGKNKQHVHPKDAICLDGKSHTEIAAIFNRAKQFISYDDYTAYSLFAVLSGCESVVVPGDEVSLLDWYPDVSDRYGIAYGFDKAQRIWADQTKHNVLEHIVNEHKKVEVCVAQCLIEMADFFQLDHQG
ncbi:WavQ [Acinetobacter indicus]|uniref:WavQ n=1 Tax=Acinetobacter indicus TaxID=756892 RepID=UPI000CEC43FB|nr:WavQ [Acinetobacter indicus]MDM1329422.1 WavQ [Acinetobacter indicus]MDM1337821.1 WavQ [Acinetobacter indicus]